MKKIYLVFAFLATVYIANAQFAWETNFDPPYFVYESDHFFIDSTSGSDFNWQIGHPYKIEFTSALSGPNALVTDSLNSIPPDEQLVFYIKHLRVTQPFHVFLLHFKYWMQGDTADRGTIEISPDQGNTWINLLTEDNTYLFEWPFGKPTLKGNTDGWQSFDIDMSTWATGWTTFPIYLVDGEVLFRFIYTSSSTQLPRDGWMIDDLRMEDWWEGIEELDGGSDLLISPNPADERFILKSSKEIKDIGLKVFSLSGHLMIEMKHYAGEQVDVGMLANGMYFIECSSGNRSTYLKLQVNH